MPQTGTREFYFDKGIDPRGALKIIRAALDDEGLSLLQAQGQHVHSVLRSEGGRQFDVVIVPNRMICPKIVADQDDTAYDAWDESIREALGLSK